MNDFVLNNNRALRQSQSTRDAGLQQVFELIVVNVKIVKEVDFTTLVGTNRVVTKIRDDTLQMQVSWGNKIALSTNHWRNSDNTGNTNGRGNFILRPIDAIPIDVLDQQHISDVALSCVEDRIASSTI